MPGTLLDRGMIPFVWYGGKFWKDLLLQSSTPVYQQLGEMAVVPKDKDEWLRIVKEDIVGANTHVYLGTLSFATLFVNLNEYHGSKDVVEGINPFGGVKSF